MTVTVADIDGNSTAATGTPADSTALVAPAVTANPDGSISIAPITDADADCEQR